MMWGLIPGKKLTRELPAPTTDGLQPKGPRRILPFEIQPTIMDMAQGQQSVALSSAACSTANGSFLPSTGATISSQTIVAVGYADSRMGTFLPTLFPESRIRLI